MTLHSRELLTSFCKQKNSPARAGELYLSCPSIHNLVKVFFQPLRLQCLWYHHLSMPLSFCTSLPLPGCVLVTESSSVDSTSNVKAPVKREGSPIEKIEPAFYQSSANNHGPSVTIKKAKTEKSG
ncbi:hypothetical protein Bca52824_046274 [Brassica carinata]|uniref:Uncharacterized protein n=1 Tax=Brassica carinata TaxID=52824 RepID=A0A8X7RE64_BRACI|nr:hypothetical protein Bca52824_046274 [Brassica carinata]